MPIVAIPNISVGGAGPELERALTAVTGAGARVLDVHSDEIHGRSVLTVAGGSSALVDAMVRLAEVCSTIDLRGCQGTHPRLGVLDVCPFVPHADEMDQAVRCARDAARRIGREVGTPVFLYGAAAARHETRGLPGLRRGGLAGLIRRAQEGLLPDEGPREIDARRGVTCVGARGPLIAFNVWLECEVAHARQIAAQVREPGLLRALGLPFRARLSQVSMNLIAPDRIGIEDAFARVETEARNRAIEVARTEIVGLVEQRYLPEPDAKATRLLIEPGRSLEDALQD